MINKYKIISSDERRAFILLETDIIILIKIAKIRNKKMFKKLISVYEHLENKTFNEDLLK